MDESDPEINFDSKGVCSHCNKFDELTDFYKKDESFQTVIKRIKKRGARCKYDCMMALSGGTDSSYLLHKLKDAGLRILVMHYDSGWNSPEANENIRRLTQKMKLDLEVYKVDKDEFKALQRAYLEAGVVDLDVPTDHALVGSMFRVAASHKISTIVSGHNIQTESIMPSTWITDKMDSRNMKDIYAQYGDGTKLNSFPFLTAWRKFWYYNVLRIEMVFLLNKLKYNKLEASIALEKEYQWKPVLVKHGESIWTRFYQCYILPTRFGIDKRKPHFSNQILSGSISRKEALAELDQAIYKNDFEEDKKMVFEKYSINPFEFDRWMNQPKRNHSDFKSEKQLKLLYAKLSSFSLFSKVLKISTRHGQA